MRIVVSADDSSGLDSEVSPHFGRCPFYVLIDLVGDQVDTVRTVENPYHAQHRPGQVPGFINSQAADVMLAGGMGRRAIGLFQQYGIQAVTGASGTVRHALKQYLSGVLQGSAPCRESLAHGQEEIASEHEHEQDETHRLHEEIEMLEQQLAEVKRRLDGLAAN